MKKMLVTGGSGFLGSRVIKYFADKYEICAPSHQEMDITIEQDVYILITSEMGNRIYYTTQTFLKLSLTRRRFSFSTSVR